MHFATILLPLLLLSACSRGGTGSDQAEQSSTLAEKTERQIPCALAGSKDFTPVCTLDAPHENGKEFWVLHHPDGGFRRFQILENGTIIATADGAFEVNAAHVGSELEVTVGDDRYRFPAAPEAAASASGG